MIVPLILVEIGLVAIFLGQYGECDETAPPFLSVCSATVPGFESNAGVLQIHRLPDLFFILTC